MSDRMVNCARCGKSIKQSEALMAPPVITTSELLRTAFKNPAMLSGPGLADVPFCADCRPLVAKQRTNEQLKFLGLLMGILLIIVLIVVFVF